ncbi:GRAM domain-containing protein 2A isoform X4 [Cervus elaphus]|uniref:GRAM domain-containing protein 2A isoform X4 n=1 Tax=Cervus canadensis TaxID=1574408 RepID=UPI001C9E9860|nr:GRAM domain-containing protein 2A isoform X4 [Cervus canadensis]XP_043776548.1 GRAM domain-containing protein 2A isoform X4 [Cervus elaphus]
MGAGGARAPFPGCGRCSNPTASGLRRLLLFRLGTHQPPSRGAQGRRGGLSGAGPCAAGILGVAALSAPGACGLPSPSQGGRRKWTCGSRAAAETRQGQRSVSNQQMRGKTASLKKSTEKLGGVQRAQDTSLSWPEGLKGEDVKKCSREGTLRSKYNQQYHKLFKDIPLEEVVLKVCSCALQRDLLLQGRLYISPNWLCFHASLFGKDIKVVIPVVSVQMIKKHKMARLLPNGLAITTNTSQKYVFVSLLSRDSVYDMLRRVCTHLQPSSKKSLCVREFPEEPECESLEALIPEMKWRKVCPASRSLSLPDSIPCISRASMESTDSFFPSKKPPGSGSASWSCLHPTWRSASPS